MRIKAIFLGLLVMTVLPPHAGAPIFGSFSGLTELVEDAKHIVVAEIVQGPDEYHQDFGGGGVYSIYILGVLKGNALPLTTAKAYLRALHFSGSTRNNSKALLPYGFRAGFRYVLFLNDRDAEFGRGGLPGDVQFKNVNSEGDAFWVPSFTPSFKKVLTLKVRNARSSIEQLLSERIKFEREQLRDLETISAEFTN